MHHTLNLKKQLVIFCEALCHSLPFWETIEALKAFYDKGMDLLSALF